MSALATAIEMAAAMRRGDRTDVFVMVEKAKRDDSLWLVVAVLAHWTAQGFDAALGDSWVDEMRLVALDDELPDWSAFENDPGAAGDPESE